MGSTLDLYSHVIPDMQDELADTMEEVLSGESATRFVHELSIEGKTKPPTITVGGLFLAETS